MLVVCTTYFVKVGFVRLLHMYYRTCISSTKHIKKTINGARFGGGGGALVIYIAVSGTWSEKLHAP